MKLLDYIKGQRKGKSANRIERDAMRDPFLFEALEGFDGVGGDHAATIRKLKSRLGVRSKPKEMNFKMWRTIAASLAIVFSLGGYLLFESRKTSLFAQAGNSCEIISIYVPQEFYADNIVLIAKTNAATMKKHTPSINQFKVEDYAVSKEEIDHELIASNTKPIDIYIPSDASLPPKGKEVYIAQHRVITPTSVGNLDWPLMAEVVNEERADVTVIEYGESNKSVLQSEKDSQGVEFESTPPLPLIGIDRYNEYLKTNLRRPTDDVCKDKHGKVAVEFSVGTDGKPANFVIKHSLCGTADKEAVRLIQSGSKWTASSQRATVKVEF